MSLSSKTADIRNFLRISKPRTLPFAASVFFLLASSLFEGIGIALILPLMDLLVNHGKSSALLHAGHLKGILDFFPHTKFREVFCVIMAGILIAALLKNMFLYFSELIVANMARRMEYVLRKQIFEKYLNFSKTYFDMNKVGGMTDIITYQVPGACEIFKCFHDLLLSLILVAVHLTIIMIISWKLTLLFLVSLPMLYFITKVISYKIIVSSNHKFEIDQRMSAYLYDTLSNISLVRASATEERESRSFQKIIEDSRQNFYGIWKKIYFANHAQDMVLTVSLAILVAISIFVLFKDDTLRLGGFMTFFIALRRFSSNLALTGGHSTLISRAYVPVMKITGILQASDRFEIKDGARSFPDLKTGIEFTGIAFEMGGTAVLDGIDLVIPKGRMTALVGSSGSGKTTLVNILLRFYNPTSGSVLIDGEDIRSFRLDSLRSRIGIVSQHVEMINASIEQNITYGFEKRVDRQTLNKVLKRVFLFDFVNALPERYDTLVGDKGVRLSGGERQRLAIARVLLKDPDIFIFDEATSALDVETERFVQAAIQELARDKTVIVIAHRLSTIKRADHIAVLEKGRIVEQGNFQELIACAGPFKQYWELQVF